MKIVMLTAKQGGGKSAVRAAIIQRLATSGVRVEGLKFADPLYELAEMIYERMGLDKTQPHFKRLLQLLGTDWGREAVDKELWVKAAVRRAETMAAQGIQVVVIDDGRFENELRAFPVLDTVTVRLWAPEHVRKTRADRWRDDVNHPSETGLDHLGDAEFDLFVNTDPASPEHRYPHEIAEKVEWILSTRGRS